MDEIIKKKTDALDQLLEVIRRQNLWMHWRLTEMARFQVAFANSSPTQTFWLQKISKKKCHDLEIVWVKVPVQISNETENNWLSLHFDTKKIYLFQPPIV